MLHTDEHVVVPFTVKSLIVFLLLLVLCTIPLWWPFRTAASAKSGKGKPDLGGEWVGTVHVTKDIQGIGLTQAIDKQGACYLKLAVYDGFLERYRGAGELALKGDRIRTLQVSELSLGEFFDESRARAAGGGARLSGTIRGDFESTPSPSDSVHDVQGNATASSIRFKTADNGPGYAFVMDLHRGTRAEYAAALKQQP